MLLFEHAKLCAIRRRFTLAFIAVQFVLRIVPDHESARHYGPVFFRLAADEQLSGTAPLELKVHPGWEEALLLPDIIKGKESSPTDLARSDLQRWAKHLRNSVVDVKLTSVRMY